MAPATTPVPTSDPPASGGPSSSANALPGKGKPAITIGDKDFAEEYLLGELYAQALQAKGYTVNAQGEHR